MRRLAWTLWVSAWIMCGCGSATREQPATTSETAATDGAEASGHALEVEPQQPPEDRPLEIAKAPPPEPVDPATCKSIQPDRDCCDACQQVIECRPNVAFDACVKRCGQSHWVEGHSVHCLALRVFWINQDGCPRIGPTWDAFDDSDVCAN